MSSGKNKEKKPSGRSGNKSGLLHGKRKRSDDKYFKKKSKPAPPPLTGKAAKRQRQLEKPHGDKVVQAKALWNKLRDQNVETEQRKALVADIMSLIGDKLWDIVARHDASRVVQACFRYGEVTHQTAILSALQGKCYELTTTQYGHHLVKCVLRHGNAAARAQVIRELTGKVVKLCTHATGSAVLELLYNGSKGHKIATKAQLYSMFKECYGREFMVFGNNSSSLTEFLAASPDRRDSVMGDLENLCERIITKGYHRFGYTHWLLHEYFAHCGPARMSAIVPSIVEATLHLASTPLGGNVLCDSLVAGGAKERKKIVKHFRGNATSVAQHECGHLVLMRALDVVDDTVLMRKAVVTELASTCIELCLDRYGYRVIMQLITPNEGRYVTNAKHMELLTKVSATSKKAPEVRREEHLKTLRPALLAGCVERCEEMLQCNTGRAILLEVIKNWHPMELCEKLGNVLGALVHQSDDDVDSNKVVADEDEEEEEEEDEEEDEEGDVQMGGSGATDADDEQEEAMTMETFVLQHLTKELLVAEEKAKEGSSEEEQISTFTTTFWEAAKSQCVELASKNRTAYVIETMLKGTIVADDVKDSLKTGEKSIRAGLKNAPTSLSIQSILQLVFPEAKGKKKAVAKKKKKAVAKKTVAKKAVAKKAVAKKAVAKKAPAKKAVAKKAPAKKAPAKKAPAKKAPAKKVSVRKTRGAKKKASDGEKPVVLRRSTRSRKGSI